MRVIAISTLRDFWDKYPDSEQELKIWCKMINEASFQSPNEVKAVIPSADQVGNNRMVFNIFRNKYRLIVVLRYKLQRVYIRFIGTHKDYDKIEDIKNI